MAFWRDRRGRVRVRVRQKRFIAGFLIFVILLGIFAYIFNLSPSSTKKAYAAWYNSGWGFRTQITLLHGQVSTNDQTNFPVLISTTNGLFKTVANSGHVALASGNDIVFTDSDGSTLLNYEIENYVAATGEIEAWVKIGTLSHTVDNTIYMYYGNASAGANSTANKQGTWDTNYKAVYHLNQVGNGTAGEYTDSTNNGNGMQGGGGTGITHVPTQTTGEIGKGESYDGGDFTLKTSPSGVPAVNATTQTYSAWYKVTTNPITSQNLMVLSNTASSGNQMHTQSGPNLGMYRWSGGTTVTALAPAQNNWHYIVWTFNNAASPKNTLYFDSSSAATSSTALQTTSPTVTSLETGSYDTVPSEPLTGLLDEVRVSASVRAPDWITTEYNNQSSPGTFETIGSEDAETAPSAPTLVTPAASATNISVFPQFSLVSPDAESDNIQYKFLLYDSDCASAPPPYGTVQTFDQTSSQTNWSQQDVDSFLAYNGAPNTAQSSTAYYQLTGTPLNPNHTYCWKGAALDPLGYNAFGSFSSTQTFTTGTSEVQIRGGTTVNGGTTIQ